MPFSPENYIPQSNSARKQLLIWALISIGSLLFIAAIIGAPLALNSGYLLVALPIYHAFSLVCHQIPERSFFIASQPFAVCARCFGLYAGFALAAITYPLVQSVKTTDAPPRKWLFVATAPLVIDYALGVLGIWNNTHTSRFITGALLGAVSVFYVTPGLVGLGLMLSSKKQRLQTTAAAPPAGLVPNVVNAPSDYSAPHRRI